MKKQFEIEFPDDPSVLDITAHDLNECMKRPTHVFSHLQSRVKVTEITDEITDVKPGDHIVPYPSMDAWAELHVLLDSVQGRGNLHRVMEDWLHEYVFTDDDAEFPESPSWSVAYFRGMPVFLKPCLDDGGDAEACAEFYAAMKKGEEGADDFWANPPSTDAWGVGYWLRKPPAPPIEEVKSRYDRAIMEWRTGFYKWLEEVADA